MTALRFRIRYRLAVTEDTRCRANSPIHALTVGAQWLISPF